MSDLKLIQQARRTADLMNERLRKMTDAERDRLIQQFIAQAMTTAQRARATADLMNLGIRLRQGRQGRVEHE